MNGVLTFMATMATVVKVPFTTTANSTTFILNMTTFSAMPFPGTTLLISAVTMLLIFVVAKTVLRSVSSTGST